ncbi:DUF4244 domain-containing protein [Streptomyces endophytica]|uniref:DUF4244 domain-containing protein n=1 Tax=Streptomyces endophytica TaxID=2991496 RepID=A0ABY6P9H2_9ACTN|nr:DUF4244 domain-containing protein [Streptomyces endophytica]UZJ30258.1 DUF4244 domain-containing protein [Streptomyces endophytica]
MFRRWRKRLCGRAADDRGMATAEYAIVTLAACALAVVFYRLITSGTVRAALRSLIEQALHAPS